MNESADPEKSNIPLTARETASIIEKFAGLYSIPGLENDRIAAALKAAAKIIATQRGDMFTASAAKKNRDSENKRRYADEYLGISLQEVRRLLDDPRVTKAKLIEMAFVRFGMPKSRLAKLPLFDAIDAIDAAASNEESLDIIALNAERSGRERKS